MKTLSDLKKAGYTKHHTALTRGYVSVKNTNGIIEKYNGKFGEGYTVLNNNPKSSQYCFKTYYVK